MSEDYMVIPLRVPRELGREWKIAAVKQDKSVQKWLLDRIEEGRYRKGCRAIEAAFPEVKDTAPHPSAKTSPDPVTPPKQASVGALMTDAVVKSLQPTDEEWIEHVKSLPVTDEEVPEKRCFKCKSRVRVWTMTDKGPICPDCKSQMEVSIP